MNKKFNFDDIVKITSTKPHHKKIKGCLGVVRGMSQNESTNAWSYGVSIYKDDGIVWRMHEEDLLKTGKKANPKYFMTEETIKVRVNPETGEGEIVDKDESKNAD